MDEEMIKTGRTSKGMGAATEAKAIGRGGNAVISAET